MIKFFSVVLLFSLISCNDRNATTNRVTKDSLHVKKNSNGDSLSHIQNRTDNSNELLKSMIFGRWQQTNDYKQIIVIKKDSIINIYDKKIITSDPILFTFEDSAKKYFMGNNIFNFDSTLDGDKLFKIMFIPKNQAKDTITNIILYVDLMHLELGYNNGLVSFKRIK